ncbi:MAG: hypothetical protein ACLVKO_08925 [Dysgonomonas sp.]
MSKRRGKKSYKNWIALIIIILIASGLYFYISHAEKKEIIESQPYKVEGSYQLLENKDTSLMARIVTETEMDVLEISSDFFKDKMFWPYIMEVNPRIENILNLTKGTIVNIPKVNPLLLDTKNPESVRKAKVLGDTLLSRLERKRAKAIEPKLYESYD